VKDGTGLQSFGKGVRGDGRRRMISVHRREVKAVAYQDLTAQFALYTEHQEISEKLFRGSGLISGKILANRREGCKFEYVSLRSNFKRHTS
jgi:hypothetical protein